ncbi:MAG: L-lactate dehydrogenase [Candidatus Magasanikbacteria bacterium]
MLNKIQSVCPAQKIAIIGAGAVGATTAYTLMFKNLASEVILIDVNEAKEEGEVLDISDGLCFAETGCVVGASFKDAADADVIILTAGAAQKPGETRLDLVNKNKAICASVFKEIGKIKSTAVIIVVANPVDIVTYMAQELSGLPLGQVFGTGTGLDTARLKTAIGKKLGVYPQSVDGFVMGEHGDSEFVPWSTVSVGGVSGGKLFSESEQKAIADDVRTEVYEIIHRKGATFYGIAAVTTDIVEAVLFNQHKVMPASTRLNNYNGVSGVCLGVPAVIGRSGVEKVWSVELTAGEKKRFKKSAETIKQYLKK